MKIKKVAKSIQDSTNENNDSKSSSRQSASYLTDYFSFTVSNSRPLTIKGLKQFMEDAIEEVRNDEDIVTITQYLALKGIPRRTYYGWLAKYDWMDDYHDIILMLVSDRNVNKMHDDFRYLHLVQPHYDPYVYKQMVEYHAKLKNQTEEDKPKVIVIEKFPSE